MSGFFANYSEQKKTIIFFGACVPARVLFAIGLYKAQEYINPVLYCALIAAMSIIILSGTTYRMKTAPDVWWNRQNMLVMSSMQLAAAILLPLFTPLYAQKTAEVVLITTLFHVGLGVFGFASKQMKVKP